MNNHVKYSPVSSHDLAIRELSPADYERMSLAEVRVPSSASHSRARSTRNDGLSVCIEGTITSNSADNLWN